MSRTLGLSELLEGALELAWRKWKPIVVVILANGAFVYGLTWVELHRGLSAGTAVAVVFAFAAIANSALILAFGEGQGGLLKDPAELFTRIVFALGAWVVIGLGVGVGLVLLVLPGLYLMARWSIAPPLILLDGSELVEAFRRSWVLTRSSTWSFVGVAAVVLGLEYLLGVSEVEPSTAVHRPATLALIAQSVIGSLLGAFATAVAVFAHGALTAPATPEDARPNNPA